MKLIISRYDTQIADIIRTIASAKYSPWFIGDINGVPTNRAKNGELTIRCNDEFIHAAIYSEVLLESLKVALAEINRLNAYVEREEYQRMEV